MATTRASSVSILAGLALLLAGCGTGAQPTAPSSTPSATAISRTDAPLAEAYPLGTRASRLLYNSSDPRGATVETSGLLLLPPGTPPEGGWPVVAWGHGTTGIGDDCAPSIRAGAYYDATLGALLEQGYAIAASDFIGLGTPGTHPYLLADSAARAMRDIVTAARSAEPSLARRWLAAGHSQGGQAAWAVAESVAGDPAGAGDYRGAVAFAPAPNFSPDVGSLVSDDPLIQQFYLMTLVGLSAAYPVDYGQYLREPARELLPDVERLCFDDLTRRIAERRLPASDFAFATPQAQQRFRDLMIPHEVAHRPARGRITVLQGGKDPVVPAGLTRELVAQAHEKGTDVTYREFPDADHGGVLNAGRTAFLDELARALR